jgi:CTP:phosphocholine cytidylyltransferase-like protein
LKTDNAIFLAAGFGSRFVPITYDLPKGLVPVRGEPLIERQIKQLKEKGIDEIFLVVGYLKEEFEYLTDKYGVKLFTIPNTR